MKGDICEKMECSICCHDTEMEITRKDIERISNLGFHDFFFEDEGSNILKNVEGHCFFLREGKCIIYHSKPKGCTLYPLIMSLPSRTPIMDEDCPHRHLFRFDPEEVLELDRLIDELEG